jgi:hypothetical protein
MDYSTLSTGTVLKLLDRAAAGSAEHEALQRELHSREEKMRSRPDRGTALLFNAVEWEGVKR